MNLGVHSRTMKIVMYTMEPRLRDSPMHGGQVFFGLFITDPPRGRPFGGGGDHRTWRRMKKNLVSFLNSSIFMGNALLQAYAQRVFTPAALDPPMR